LHGQVQGVAGAFDLREPRPRELDILRDTLSLRRREARGRRR
jgi:hypothetical protein